MPTFDPRSAETTLFAALLAAARAYGKDKVILQDAEPAALSYRRLILASLVLGDKLAANTRPAETIGVLLPNVNALIVTVFGLNAFGRVTALLNFSAGSRNVASAVRTAVISKVITSRRFIEQGKLQDLLSAIARVEVQPGRPTEIVYLEDVRKAVTVRDKAIGLLRSQVAGAWHRRHAVAPSAPAIILFTSGTEGEPKGVVLSNRNLVANAHQIFLHATGVLSQRDIVFNPLPMFHSYGLTAGMLMPLLNGLKAVLYPSPLHYRQIPKLVRDTHATMLVATDTFLQGYARAAEPGDLDSVRFVVAGAERVKDNTRDLWDASGTVLLEGYGATECSPVVAYNLPETNRPGTVGSLLPGIDYEVEPVEGIAEGGRLKVRGANIMVGYLYANEPGVVVPPQGGWHDTGDIVKVDTDRFVTILGRAKRFAKVGGEMISLAAVENVAYALWPDNHHAVLGQPDPRKGEQLLLITDKADADRTVFLRFAQHEGLSELCVPRVIMTVERIPLLATGKVDYTATAALVAQHQAQHSKP